MIPIKIYVWWNNSTKNVVIKYTSRVVDIEEGSINGFGHELLQVINLRSSPHSFLERQQNKLKYLYREYKYSKKIKDKYRREYKEKSSYHLKNFKNKN